MNYCFPSNPLIFSDNKTLCVLYEDRAIVLTDFNVAGFNIEMIPEFLEHYSSVSGASRLDSRVVINNDTLGKLDLSIVKFTVYEGADLSSIIEKYKTAKDMSVSELLLEVEKKLHKRKSHE